MEEENGIGRRSSRLIAFSTAGILSVTQDLAGHCLESIEGADPEIVAEETLCLTAVATARAVEVGSREAADEGREAGAALLDLPFIYRDYLVGNAVLESGDDRIADAQDRVYERLQRKREFYQVHLPGNTFPGERLLHDKMGLWMGRVSPPGLPETPTDRLAKLELVPVLARHLRLVLTYARK